VTSRPTAASGRSALAVHLELSHGRHGASASVAFHDTESGTLACVAVRGWIEGSDAPPQAIFLAAVDLILLDAEKRARSAS